MSSLAVIAPLGYVEHGQDSDTRDFFNALQTYLLSADAQAQIAADGRRTALGMAKPAPPEKDWNFDPSRVVLPGPLGLICSARAAKGCATRSRRPPDG